MICFSGYAAEQFSSSANPTNLTAQENLINKLLTSSGLDRGLKKFPEQIIAGIKTTGSEQKFPPAVHGQVINIYTESFPKDGFLNRTTAALKKNYDSSRYTQVVDLLSTPLAKKIIALEAEDPTPADLQKYINGLQKQSVSNERLELIKKLDSYTQSSNLLTKITMTNIELSLWAASDDCANPEEIKKELESLRPVINERTRNSVYLMFAYTYRNLSDAEFKEYIKTYEHKDSRWVLKIINASIEEEFKAGSTKAAQPMKLLLKSLRPPKTMFAPKCENQSVVNESQSEKISFSKPRTYKTNNDLRDCLKFEESSKIIACTEHSQ